MKRIIICLLMLLLLTVWIPTIAADSELTIGQVDANMPEVTVYFAPPEEIGEDFELDARLGGETLTFIECEQFNSSGEGVWYIFAVDCSTSMTSRQMQAIRGAINEIAGEMGTNDRVTIISFGKELEIPVNLSANPDEIIAAASALEANQNGTLFYDAIVKALELGMQYGDDIPVRRAAFVFSDAEDYNVGGYVDWEVESRLKSSDMAMYALGFQNKSREVLDNFGAMARLSGGAIEIVTADSVEDTVISLAGSVKDGYIARFQAATNIISGNAETLTLTLTAGSASHTSQREVTPARWMPDNVPPSAVSATQTGPVTISVVFDEPVLGAESISNYRIENANGDLLAISTVSYDEMELMATLTFNETPQSGEITITFPGITDASMEKNTLTLPLITGYTAPESEPTEQPTVPPADEEIPPAEGETTNPVIWIIASLAIVLIIIGVIFGAKKSRGGHVAGREEIIETSDGSDAVKYKFVTGKAPELKLRVIDASGAARDVAVPVPGSAFVGRAEGNDLVFDDKRMSRQHFAVEAKNGGFMITNLSEVSPAMLNGVPLASPRPLREGDKIEAGSITFVVL